MILFGRRKSGQPVISRRIKRRRIFTVVSLVLLLLFSAFLVTSKYYNAPTTAAEFVADENNLVVPENTLLYIGSGGYVSQRLRSKDAEPINTNHQLSPNVAPAGHIYNTVTRSMDTDTDWFGDAVWGQDVENSWAIVGDGTGMILKYNQKIDIYGTVVIGDRVVLDSPNINIYSSGKIYANGQDNQLGAADKTHCGTGGIGGINGGTNAENLVPKLESHGVYFVDCLDDETQGGPSTDPNFKAIAEHNLKEINDDVRSYFVLNDALATGGDGSDSSLPLTTERNTSYGIGAVATIGVGGGGAGGSTGSNVHDYSASSGGGGGGFGLVLKSDSLFVNSAATISAAGGNSSVDKLYSPQHTFPAVSGLSPAGAFGGPGGGGVIVINSSSVQFRSGSNNESEALANYSIFNTKAGTLTVPAGYDLAQGIDDKVFQRPPGAVDGKLVIHSAKANIKKTVSPLNVNPGEDVTVTLLAPVAIGAYNIEDEFLNDGNGKYFTFSGALPTGCLEDGRRLICTNVITSLIIYHLKAPIN